MIKLCFISLGGESGFDALQVDKEVVQLDQRQSLHVPDTAAPFNLIDTSSGTSFRRSCQELGVPASKPFGKTFCRMRSAVAQSLSSSACRKPICSRSFPLCL